MGLEDLYQPLESHRANNLGAKLEKAWDQECQKKRMKGQQPSLMVAGLRVFGFDIAVLGFLVFTSDILFRALPPIFLGGLVSYYANPETSNISEAYWYSAGIIVCSFLNALTMHALMLNNRSWGMRIRTAACSILYRKALRLSKTALINTSPGQIVNLLTNDARR